MSAPLKLAALALPALIAACATQKISADDAFGPELRVHTIPEGATLLRDGKPLGNAPLGITARANDSEFHLEAQAPGFEPNKVTVDAAAIRRLGGGETWLALKPTTMGTDSPQIDATDAHALDRAGVSLSKARRCDEALQFFARALAVDPAYAKAHRDRANCFIRKQQYPQAAADLEAYLDATPNAPDTEKVEALVAKLQGSRQFDIPLEKPSGDN